MRAELEEKKLFLLSKREPYMHIKEGRRIACIVPAGGLVTALAPVMRVCDGIWIAHGSGDAVREAVDSENKLQIPPDEPAFTLKGEKKSLNLLLMHRRTKAAPFFLPLKCLEFLHNGHFQ